MTTPRDPRPVSDSAPASSSPSPEPAGDIWHLRVDRVRDDGSRSTPGTPWTVSTFADGEWKVISRHPTEASARAAVASMESTGNDQWR